MTVGVVDQTGNRASATQGHRQSITAKCDPDDLQIGVPGQNRFGAGAGCVWHPHPAGDP